ncbi:shootin-1-like isoform X2 [Dreissena polymorpha]|nr:shootin-1-like isoform X2 [Dreissena polymorpha]
MEDIEENEIDWKTKYEEISERLEGLEKISKDVLKEYEELTAECETLKTENASLAQKIIEKDKQIKEVNSLVQPAIAEYGKLKKKYSIEKECRQEAEYYACEVVQHNKKLKRQSMDLIGLMNRADHNFNIRDIKFEDEEEPTENRIENAHQQQLNTTIKNLKKEVSTLSTKLELTEIELKTEKENHQWVKESYETSKYQLKQTESALRKHKLALQELSKVSEEALTEYESLKGKYALEKKRRSFVEKKVAEITVDNSKLKRQSAALLSSVVTGDRLHHALMEIEDLTDKLEKQRQHYDQQIAELEERISEGSAEQVSKSVENTSLITEREDLEAKLRENEDKYTSLEAKYDKLLKAYEDSKRPPPPPPPPPPPAVNKGFLSMFKRTKKPDVQTMVKKTGGVVNEDFNKALEEMMENIKHGRSLRPTLKPVKESTDASGHSNFRMVLKSKSFDEIEKKPKQEGAAMIELSKIMQKMKCNNSGPELEPIVKDQGNSELAQVFRRVKKSGSIDESPVNMRIKLSQVHEERESEVILRKKPAVSADA